MEISIVVPTYNRAKILKKCLGSLSAQDYPREKYEVIIIDDGSDEDLDKTIANFQERHNFRLIKQSHQGISYARNRGIKEAKADIIVFLEDDCIVSCDWLTNIHRIFNSNPEIEVLQFRIDSQGKSFFEKINQAYLDTFVLLNLFFPKDKNLSSKILFFLSNLNKNDRKLIKTNLLPVFRAACFKKEVFCKCGLFNENLSYREDREFAWKLLKNNISAWYCHELVVRHQYPSNLKESLLKQFDYGKGIVDLKKKYADYPFILPNNFRGILFYILRIFAYPLWKTNQLSLKDAIIYLPFFFLLNFAYISGVFYEIYFCSCKDIRNNEK